MGRSLSRQSCFTNSFSWMIADKEKRDSSGESVYRFLISRGLRSILYLASLTRLDGSSVEGYSTQNKTPKKQYDL